MRVKEISYAMLRVTKAYENDRVEVTVEINEGEEVGDAVKLAKNACKRALVTTNYEGF